MKSRDKVYSTAGDVITAEMLSERMPAWSEYEIDGKKLKFWLSEDNPSITLQEDVNEYSIILKYVRNLYTVCYTDGVAGEIVFPDEEHDECREGDSTPEFSDSEALERKGYTFMGWTPAVNQTVSGEDAEYFEGENKWVIEYQATWEKN